MVTPRLLASPRLANLERAEMTTTIVFRSARIFDGDSEESQRGGHGSNRT
jgi:hypothetical protein